MIPGWRTKIPYFSGQLLSLHATTRGSMQQRAHRQQLRPDTARNENIKKKICFHHSFITLTITLRIMAAQTRDLSVTFPPPLYQSRLLSFLHLFSFLNPFLLSAFLQSLLKPGPGHPPPEDYHSLLIGLSSPLSSSWNPSCPAP